MYITSIGGLLIDLIFDTPEWPKPGLSVTTNSYHVEAGGKGLIQAVSAARLGVHSAIIGRVGDDIFGESLIKVLDYEDVDRRYLIQDRQYPTGVVGVIRKDFGEEGYIGAQEASRELKKEHIDDAAELFANSDVLILNLDVGTEIISYTLDSIAKHSPPAHQIRLITLSPPQKIEASLLKQWAKTLEYFVVNEKEATIVLGKEKISGEEAAQQIVNITGKQALITEGYNGGWFASKKEAFVFNPIPVSPEHVLGFRGAKDVFCVGFASALIQGSSLHDAILYGCVASSRMLFNSSAILAIPDTHSIQGTIRKLLNTGFKII